MTNFKICHVFTAAVCVDKLALKREEITEEELHLSRKK